MILAVGEALMEFRRLSSDGVLSTAGEWAGPFPSGAPAIFASVAARLGAPAALVGGVGDDRFGHALVARLRRDAVGIDALQVVPGRATAVAFVAYDQAGGRDFWFSVHDSAAMALDLASADRAARSADWLHVSGSTLAFGGAIAAAVEASAERVGRAGGRISLDPNLRPDASANARARTARLVKRADVVLPSEGELEALGLNEGDVARRALICRTLGAEGVRLSGAGLGNDACYVPAPVADEVDPTGAGDTFAAAFVTRLRVGADPLAAARFACETAARSVSVLGAMEAPVDGREPGA